MVNKSKNVERFKVLNKSSSSNLLFYMSQIEWKNNTRDLMKPLLVTIPGCAGNAVKRNRWKRIVKEWYRSEGLSMSPRQSLWIRFNRNKKLNQKILTKDWVLYLSQEAKKLKTLKRS